MKKLLTTLLLCAVCALGCEKEEEKDCKCDECPCEQIRDAEVQEEDSDMGLDGGSEEDQGGEEAGAEQEDLDGGQDVSEGGEEQPEEDCSSEEGEEDGCEPEEAPEE